MDADGDGVPPVMPREEMGRWGKRHKDDIFLQIKNFYLLILRNKERVFLSLFFRTTPEVYIKM